MQSSLLLKKLKQQPSKQWNNLVRSFASSSSSSSSDMLVIGTGVAGTAAALRASQLNPSLRITLLTSAPSPTACNSYWAQGGIIYKGGVDDSPSLLASDIQKAGVNVCNDVAVSKVSREGPAAVENLLLNLAQTDFERHTDDSRVLKLTLEASHSSPRIIYRNDCTGKVITTSMLDAVSKFPNITVVPSAMVTKLLTDNSVITGARVLDTTMKSVVTFNASNVVLATGGCGALYRNTSNPASALGSGIALGLDAGVSTENMEYMQFHPTTLYIPNESRFLMTEALRGEGAILKNHRGEAFAKSYHPDGELAPRDVVARMILSEMEKATADFMYLDISHRDPDWLRSRFPTIAAYTSERGIDFTKSPLPITPSAHYHCGGLRVHPETGATMSVQNLYAAGEVACTGLHGANRLASTSLLEGLVYGSSIAEAIVDKNVGTTLTNTENMKIQPHHLSPARVAEMMTEMQSIMWSNVGPVRNAVDMEVAVTTLRELAAEAHGTNNDDADTLLNTDRADVVSLVHALTASQAIATSALNATESLGTHFLKPKQQQQKSSRVSGEKNGLKLSAPLLFEEQESKAVVASALQ